MKIGIEGDEWTAEYYEATVVSAVDYYPFGSAMEERTMMASDYRFGFNGQEQDGEVMDGAVVFKYRVHDPRIGKFLSVDPLAPDYPWNSSYAFAENRVIDGIDLEGLEWFYYQAAGETAPTAHWHVDATEMDIITGYETVNGQRQAVVETIQAQDAIVVVNGDRNEQLATNNTLNGAGAIAADITVYGPGGEDDINTYTGYTMTSDAAAYTPIDEGSYIMKRRNGQGSGSIPKHYKILDPDNEDNPDHIRTMDGVANTNPGFTNQFEDNGEGYKDAIFLHRTNSSGTAGPGKVSTGCILVVPADMTQIDNTLSPLGNNSLNDPDNTTSIMFILSRAGAPNNPTFPVQVPEVLTNPYSPVIDTMTDFLYYPTILIPIENEDE
jgi:RHS repeat-associated protein